jgi:hypothetical protein
VWMIRRRSWMWVAPVVLACLVGLSYYLDTILRGYMERAMNQRITGYSVRIRAVRFHPIGFSVDLLDLTVAQDQHPDPPVLHIPRLRASVDWGALLDRRLVADFLVQRPKLYVNLNQARAEIDDKTAMRERGWREALESIYPLKINVFRVEAGEVMYVDRGPFRPLRLSRVQLHADNIRNVRSPDHVYPSPIHLDAVVFDSGKVVLDGNANFLAEPHPGLRASLSLDGVALDYFKPITERYNVAVRGGVLSSSGEVEYAPTAKNVNLHAVSICDVDLEYVHTPETAAAEKQTVEQIRAAATQVTNHPDVRLRADDVNIRHSTFTFRNHAANTPYRVTLADVQIRLANVTNQRAEGKVRGDMKGKFMGSGDAAVHLALSPDVKRPEFDVTVRVDETELPAMNDVLRAYAGVDAVAGRFSLYSEVSVRQGSVSGYVKPLFKDMDLYDARQDRDKTFFHKVKEGLMAAAAWALKNRDRGEVATKVNLSGPLDSPQFSNWEALGGFLENAFVRAILPGFEGKDRSGSG